jgi:hypothetical protein
VSERIIIIAPHPDDEYFVADFLFESYDITICLVTNGDSNFDSQKYGDDYRLRESIGYAKMIGASIVNFDLSCADLNVPNLNYSLASIDFSCFDFVCLVEPYDWHPDHRLITKSVIEYLDFVNYKGDLLFYEVTSKGLDKNFCVVEGSCKYDLQHILRRNCFKSQLNLLKREDFRRLKGLALNYRYAIASVQESIKSIDFNRYGSYEELILSLGLDIF